MAEMNPMMAAIAAARKTEKQKKKAIGPAVPGATIKSNEPGEFDKARIYEVNEKVLYLSASKGGWVDAKVLRRDDKDDGSYVYELDVKFRVTPDKIRPRPGPEVAATATASSSFVSFDTFAAKPSMKRSVDDDDTDRRYKKVAKAQVTEGAEHVFGQEDSCSDGEMTKEAKLAAEIPIDWSDPPKELMPRDHFGENEAGAFIEHFVRFFVGAWRRVSEAGFPGFSDMERRSFKDSLHDTEEAMAPLLRQLRMGANLQKGEGQGEVVRRTGARTACDGRAVKEASVLEQLERMAVCGAEREYKEAHAAYMKLTLGNKTWNLTHTSFVSANSGSGAREYRRNRDSLNTYDMDPVAQRYMQRMRKLVQLSQCLRPNDDHSKNVVL